VLRSGIYPLLIKDHTIRMPSYKFKEGTKMALDTFILDMGWEANVENTDIDAANRVIDLGTYESGLFSFTINATGKVVTHGDGADAEWEENAEEIASFLHAYVIEKPVPAKKNGAKKNTAKKGGRGGRNNIRINYGGQNVVPNVVRQTNASPAKHFQKSRTSNITRKNMRLPPVQHASHNAVTMAHAANFQVHPSHITNYIANSAKSARPANRLFVRNQATRRLQTGRLAHNVGTRRLAAAA
jgi:hypothetical protein